EDLSIGILETIDMDSYRVEVKSSLQISLPDQDSEIGPVPTSGGGYMPEPEIDKLSNILKTFNDQFGSIEWKNADKIGQVITEEIPAKVAEDKAYQNAMKNSDKQNARIEHDRALSQVIMNLLSDHTDLFKLYSDDQSFKKWLSDNVFSMTFQGPETRPEIHPR
ncbi:MAG: type I restriction endonuclease subunit R, partial [Proteobacteria bacterium]|nr:type I restriction endonuclease subunit R [Pseudomonadota bacterium]